MLDEPELMIRTLLFRRPPDPAGKDHREAGDYRCLSRHRRGHVHGGYRGTFSASGLRILCLCFSGTGSHSEYPGRNGLFHLASHQGRERKIGRAGRIAEASEMLEKA